MEKHWKAMWPVLSTGGSCVLVSTVNGLGNWYAETYNKAKEGKNMFHVIDLDYWEHPEYSEKKHPNWVKEQHQQLGEKGFMQEVMRSFLGSGETYFPSTVIVELDKQTSDFKPIKKLFPNFSNKDVSSEEKDDEFSRGALWIWKEPVEGHEYIIGVDPAEGIGSDGDNSCIQIISATTNEQVAEFYSNLITPHDLAQIINELGLYYNNALVAVEDMSSGGIILNALQNSPLMYENLYISTKNNRNNRPGIKITVNNRSMMLQEMQSRVINFSLKIRSKRLVREINTFEYNPQTKKAEAVKGKHDDAIMALAIANYVRDEMYKDIPVGFDNGESLSQMNMVSDLRKQLREGLESHVSNIYENNKIEKNEADAFISLHRKNDSLLREFGW